MKGKKIVLAPRREGPSPTPTAPTNLLSRSQCLGEGQRKEFDYALIPPDSSAGNKGSDLTPEEQQVLNEFPPGLPPLRDPVKSKIEDSNSKYKARIDKHRRQVLFDVGDFVWAVLTRDRFPVGEYNKLKDRKIGPCEIVQKINDNAYRLRLPSHLKASDVFNVKHLTRCFMDSDDDGINSRTSSFQPGETDAGANDADEADLSDATKLALLYHETQEKRKSGTFARTKLFWA